MFLDLYLPGYQAFAGLRWRTAHGKSCSLVRCDAAYAWWAKGWRSCPPPSSAGGWATRCGFPLGRLPWGAGRRSHHLMLPCWWAMRCCSGRKWNSLVGLYQMYVCIFYCCTIKSARCIIVMCIILFTLPRTCSLIYNVRYLVSLVSLVSLRLEISPWGFKIKFCGFEQHLGTQHDFEMTGPPAVCYYIWALTLFIFFNVQ